MIKDVSIIENVTDALGKYPELFIGIGDGIKPVRPGDADLVAASGLQPKNTEGPERELCLNLSGINHDWFAINVDRTLILFRVTAIKIDGLLGEIIGLISFKDSNE